MKRLIMIVKWWPIITNLVIVAIFSLSFFNVYVGNVLSPLFGTSMFIGILWYYLSTDCHFCAWHRVLIINLILISAIVLIDKTFYSFQSLFYVKLIISISFISICISWISYKKYGCFKK